LERQASPRKPGKRISLLIGMFFFFGSRIVRTHLFGVELAGLVVRFYFGITGCIIPVAASWTGTRTSSPSHSRALRFRWQEGIYMFYYSPAPCETHLSLNRIYGLQGFATIAYGRSFGIYLNLLVYPSLRCE
jgi:hypothetical protein